MALFKSRLEKIWERKVRVDQIIRRLWFILGQLKDCGHGNCKVAFEVRSAISRAKNVKGSIEEEINLI